MPPNGQSGRDAAGSAARISIVVPAYNEEGNLPALYARLAEVLHALNMAWEIVFVDDGSTDKTWEAIVALHRRDRRATGLRLSRHFGHQYALFAGLTHATGDVVVSMDADLQHPPHVIPELVDEWRKGSKIVHTIRLDRENTPWFKGVASKLFYKVYSFASGVGMESGMADFRPLDRQVIANLSQLREEELFLRGLVQWIGFPSSKVAFRSQERLSGRSKDSLRRMLKLAWSSITSFSIIPLRVGLLIGILTSLISFGGILYALGSLRIGFVVPGWTSIVSISSFLFGVLFSMLGVIGEYIGRVLMEVKSRPRFLVSDHVGIERPLRDTHREGTRGRRAGPSCAVACAGRENHGARATVRR
jgi:dolichol-phosphate mannosyltransferase